MQEKNILDITDFREHGKELVTAIENAVYETQRYIMRPLPDWIHMKKSQFEELAKIHGLPDMYDSDERMYITKHNIMQIEVVDKEQTNE